MSLKRLNFDERATYLMGKAVRRQLFEAPRDPETIREIEAVCRWISHWLTLEEYEIVSSSTGMILDPDDYEDFHNPVRPPSEQKPPSPPSPDYPF